MTKAPKLPRTSTKVAPTEVVEDSTIDSAIRSQEKCLFAELRGVIAWMNGVDDFTINGHKNYLPRWAFVMLILLFFAFT